MPGWPCLLSNLSRQETQKRSASCAGMLFCWEIDGVEVLVIDATQECWTASHKSAYIFAWAFMLILGIGTPFTMWYAAMSFYNSLDDDRTMHHHSKHMAKMRYHSSWKMMKKRARHKAIAECMFELRMEMLSAQCFLLTSFQMAVSQRASYWYPQWHLLRRTIINLLYFEGLRSGDGTVGYGDNRADWRVLMVVLLAVSDLLQIRFDVFRGHTLDNLEMWSLHFLLVVVVIDIANESISFYLCMMLSSVFFALVLRDIHGVRIQEAVAASGWAQVRKSTLTRTLKDKNEAGRLQQSLSSEEMEADKSDDSPKAKILNPLVANGRSNTSIDSLRSAPPEYDEESTEEEVEADDDEDEDESDKQKDDEQKLKDTKSEDRAKEDNFVAAETADGTASPKYAPIVPGLE